MDLNAEINKVFGEEMANLISASIPEEELCACAKQAWKDINRGDYYGSNKPINRMVEAELMKRVQKEVEGILDSEDGQSTVHEQAVELIAKIQEKTKEYIVESISSRIAEVTAGYNGYGLKNYVADIVRDMLR